MNFFKANQTFFGLINRPNGSYAKILRADIYKEEEERKKDTLSSTCHCHELYKKCSRITYLICKSFISRNSELKMRAYKIYVLPILDYCSSVYNPWKISDINLLERIQRRFTKNILKNGMSYEDRLKHLRICSLEKRRLILDLLLTYKILHGKIPDLINMFCYNDVPSNTRSSVSSLLKIPKLRLDIKKYSFPNRMSKIFRYR